MCGAVQGVFLCVYVCEVAKLKKLFACKFVVRIGKRKREIIKAKAKNAGETYTQHSNVGGGTRPARRQSYDKAIKKDERGREMWMKKRENKRGRCLMTETMRNTKERAK